MKLMREIKMFLKTNKCRIANIIARRKLQECESGICEEVAERNASKIKSNVEELGKDDGNACQSKFWKLKKKLTNEVSEPPVAKKDDKGNIITAPSSLKNLYTEVYTKRLSKRTCLEKYESLIDLKERLWEIRLDLVSERKTTDWNAKQLDNAIKMLKNNKCGDPNGIINEIFKENYAGKDFKKGLLSLFNGIKSTKCFPEFMCVSDICSIRKKKAALLDIEGERGISLITGFKKIFENLLYLDFAKDIDGNMTDSNIGSRKERDIKDHILVMNGIINSVIKGKGDEIDIQIFDIEKAFDSLWLENCLSDTYDSLSEHNRNEKLALLYKMNKKNLVSIRTPYRMTKR